jgi:F-type H+-transporting ATPase subunit a
MSLWLLAVAPNVSLKAEPITTAGPLTLSNSMLLGLIGTLSMIGLLFYTRVQAAKPRPSRLATAVLWIFEMLMNTAQDVLGSREQARRLMPLAVTIFFLILINNWFELLPIVGPVTWHGQPLLRGLAADLNFTAALAILTMVAAQIWGIRERGVWGNMRRYIANPFKDPIHAFEGSLEFVAEFSRGTALALRLFGNIFGGEVLMLIVAYITAWAAPLTLPVFMIFELFIGTVQAYIFFMLAVVFVSFGSAKHGTEEEPAASPLAAAATTA